MPKLKYSGFIESGGRLTVPPDSRVAVFDIYGFSEVDQEVVNLLVGHIPGFSVLQETLEESKFPACPVRKKPGPKPKPASERKTPKQPVPEKATDGDTNSSIPRKKSPRRPRSLARRSSEIRLQSN